MKESKVTPQQVAAYITDAACKEKVADYLMDNAEYQNLSAIQEADKAGLVLISLDNGQRFNVVITEQKTRKPEKY